MLGQKLPEPKHVLVESTDGVSTNQYYDEPLSRSSRLSCRGLYLFLNTNFAQLFLTAQFISSRTIFLTFFTVRGKNLRLDSSYVHQKSQRHIVMYFCMGLTKS